MPLKSFKKILKYGDQFLIEIFRLIKGCGDENIPLVQRNLFKLKQKYKNKKIYIATKFTRKHEKITTRLEERQTIYLTLWKWELQDLY